MGLRTALSTFTLQDRRLLIVNACIGFPALALTLALSAYFFATEEPSNGRLLLVIGLVGLVVLTISYAVLARRGTLRRRSSR